MKDNIDFKVIFEMDRKQKREISYFFSNLKTFAVNGKFYTLRINALVDYKETRLSSYGDGHHKTNTLEGRF